LCAPGCETEKYAPCHEEIKQGFNWVFVVCPDNAQHAPGMFIAYPQFRTFKEVKDAGIDHNPSLKKFHFLSVPCKKGQGIHNEVGEACAGVLNRLCFSKVVTSNTNDFTSNSLFLSATFSVYWLGNYDEKTLTFDLDKAYGEYQA
jgi:hypothetical protein